MDSNSVITAQPKPMVELTATFEGPPNVDPNEEEAEKQRKIHEVVDIIEDGVDTAICCFLVGDDCNWCCIHNLCYMLGHCWSDIMSCTETCFKDCANCLSGCCESSGDNSGGDCCGGDGDCCGGDGDCCGGDGDCCGGDGDCCGDDGCDADCCTSFLDCCTACDSSN